MTSVGVDSDAAARARESVTHTHLQPRWSERLPVWRGSWEDSA